MENTNPYNKNLHDIAIIGAFDMISKRKVSAIKKAVANHGMKGSVHIGIIADMPAYHLQEVIPHQEEERRAKMIILTTGIKSTLLMEINAIRQYIEEKKDYCRFIILSTESKPMKDSLKTILEEFNCVYSVLDAFNSDNARAIAYFEKQKTKIKQ